MNSWEDVRSYMTTFIFGLLIGWLCGWLHAHSAVAEECRKLGSFYVGKSVFKCSEIVTRDEKD